VRAGRDVQGSGAEGGLGKRIRAAFEQACCHVDPSGEGSAMERRPVVAPPRVDIGSSIQQLLCLSGGAVQSHRPEVVNRISPLDLGPSLVGVRLSRTGLG
jgi:hypothetical protein